MTSHYRSKVFPLLFDLCYIKNKVLLEKYNLVDSIEEADVAIVPVEIGYFLKKGRSQWLFDFIAEANLKNKKVWIYTAGDTGITLNKFVYTFRLGGFSTNFDDKTFVLPSFIMDPYDKLEKKFKPIVKEKLPKIGFVGHANGSIFKYGKEFFIYIYHNIKRFSKHVFTDYQSFYPSSSKRYVFLKALEKNKNIETDFIFRKKYRAGIKTEEEKQRTTLEFLENIYDLPYTFCMRGAGNFSVRLYETLAMGRIPLVIDTDIRLPLSNSIPWEKHCLIASENNFMDELIRFHSNIDSKYFEQMQINNRNLWLNSLTREAYFENIYIAFKSLL